MEYGNGLLVDARLSQATGTAGRSAATYTTNGGTTRPFGRQARALQRNG